MQRKIGELVIANDFYKKITALNLKEKKLLVDHKDLKLSVSKKLKLLNINHSSYYYKSKLPNGN